MGQLTFHIKYNKSTDSIVTPNDIRQNYLFGINIQRQGISLTDDVYQFYIDAAVEQLQNYLGIKFKLQVIQETKDFIRDDWQRWGFLKVTWPAVCPLALLGFLGSVLQVTYPSEWMSTRKTSDNELYQRSIYLVPNTNSTQTDIVSYVGVLPSAGLLGSSIIPNYWTVTYTTGFPKGVPTDIKNAIGMIAAMNILLMVQDGMLLYPGQQSTSLSLDGLSQSISTNNQGIFYNRIRNYRDLMWGDGKNNNSLLKQLYDRYAAFTWGTC